MEAKVYSSANRLTVVAPMPGFEASQIGVSVAGDLLTIETAGGSPEHRECRVALPGVVNAAAAMAAYAYGVLVITIPLANPGGPLDELGPGLVKRPQHPTGDTPVHVVDTPADSGTPTGG